VRTVDALTCPHPTGAPELTQRQAVGRSSLPACLHGPPISLAQHCLNALARGASCSCSGVTRCSAGALAAPSQQATRHARRVYVGGLPPTATEQNVATFFSNALAAIGGTTAGPGEAALSALPRARIGRRSASRLWLLPCALQVKARRDSAGLSWSRSQKGAAHSQARAHAFWGCA